MIKRILLNYIYVVLINCFLGVSNAGAENSMANKSEEAIFAGGCFWCMEAVFEPLPGIIKTISGYTGGHTENPTYKEVSNGKTGHSEVVKITYDPSKISYETLLEVFWRNIDPFDNNGQFCDKGDQYKATLFYTNTKQKQLAEASKVAIQEKFMGKPIVTAIKGSGKFFPAEDYHQDYYLKNPYIYKFYRFTCGRDRRLSKVWG